MQRPSPLRLPLVPASLAEPALLRAYLEKLNAEIVRGLEHSRQGAVVRLDNLKPMVRPAGDKDGSNRTFVVPHVLVRNAAGEPLAPLFWKTGFLSYTTGAAPGGGEWTIPGGQDAAADTTEILMGDAPLSGDDLVFPLAVVF